MTKRKRQGELEGCGENIPKEVQKACDSYREAMLEHTMALGKKNTAFQVAVDTMRERGITRCRSSIDGKILELSDAAKLTIRKAKETPVEEGTEEIE